MSAIFPGNCITVTVLVCVAGMSAAFGNSEAAQDEKPARETPAPQTHESGTTNQQDPFSDLPDSPKPQQTISSAPRSWKRTFFTENFSFKKEVMSQFDVDQDGHGASRQSLGFEVLKKFSTSTSTVASFDFQGRLVRRDGFNPVLNDMEGQTRPGWAFEYHNLYVDLYNVVNPVLNDEQRGKNIGRFNFRAGRFYVPFGLNLRRTLMERCFSFPMRRTSVLNATGTPGFGGA